MIIYREKMITIKRKIIIDDEQKKFIFNNINYRRKVYNDFVNEYYRLNKDGTRVYTNPSDFDPIKFKTLYYNNIEKPLDAYSRYCTGISEQVAKDMKSAISSMYGTGRIFRSDFKYKKFDRYRGSFTVNAKGTMKKRKTKLNDEYSSFISKVFIEDNRTVSFSIGEKHRLGESKIISRKYKSRYLFKTKEKIFNSVTYIENKSFSPDPIYVLKTKTGEYNFREKDIKTVGFKHELGQFYILLSIAGKYVVNKDKDEHLKSSEICGIDLGIHNPITLYTRDLNDYEKIIYYRFNNKILNRIKYLERRKSRIQKIKDKKLKNNGNIKSKNYYRILRKYRVTCKKITNIKLNWRRQVCNKIARKYKVICIDFASIPLNNEHMKYNIPKYKWKKINSANRLHAISYIPRIIETECEKYGDILINSPQNSTRACSFCGYINKPLKLNQRIFSCKNCNNVMIDRDENAAKNCYIHALNTLIKFKVS